MALSDFKGLNYITDWSSDLDRRWPERIDIFPTIVQAIFAQCQNPNRENIHLLELGPGAGCLAKAILSLLTSHLDSVSYLGIDINPELTAYTQKQLSRLGYPNISLKTTDLNNNFWPRDLDSFDIVYTFQTLHDLGGYEALKSVYEKLFALIRPGGLLLNTDFVIPFTNDNLKKPKRFPVERHQQLLESIGFIEFECQARVGKLACITALRP